MTQLERFIQKGEIEISQDPDNNKKRLAVLDNNKSSLQWFPNANQIILDFIVYFLDENGDKIISQRFKPYEKRLWATNDVKLNSKFNVVEKPVEIKNESGKITNQEEIDSYNNLNTEYEVIINLAKITPVFNLALQFVQLRDSQGMFNI